MSTLAIISHTEHYRSHDGQILGLSSTVSEINHLLEIFDHIYHLGMLHDSEPPPNTLAYASDHITFVPLPALGGTRLTDKFRLLTKAPKLINEVRKVLRSVDHFQFRAPTGIGVYIIPYLILFQSKSGWYKYAGNWKQEHAPLAYKIQRWLLKRQQRIVTINGNWYDQPKHCISFENPCLTTAELREGEHLVKNKALSDGKFNLCFVGRLEEAKGIGILLTALDALTTEERSKVNMLHIVGESTKRAYYESKAKTLDIDVQFYGLVNRIGVHEVYKKCNAIILPSASEGFPKVITEAMNYGCLPVVSNVSSISEYVKDGINGFLCYPSDLNSLVVTLKRLLCQSNDDYRDMINNNENKIERFTYSYYNKRIKSEVLKL